MLRNVERNLFESENKTERERIGGTESEWRTVRDKRDIIPLEEKNIKRSKDRTRQRIDTSSVSYCFSFPFNFFVSHWQAGTEAETVREKRPVHDK